MKTLRTAISFAMMLSALSAVAEPNSQKSFDLLKSFSGAWEGNTVQGKTVQVSFRTTAAGSALVSEITMPGMKGEDMISMFHMDNDRLLLTHYCSAGNQPRLVASLSADGKTVTFDFLDATNLPSPQAGHMRHAVYIFTDSDHYSQEWTWMEDGKGTTFRSEMQRRK